MKKKMKTTGVVLCISLVSLMFIFGGCTRYANQDDLNRLEQQKQAALSAEQRVKELEEQKADLERQIADVEKELQEQQNVLRQIQ